MPNDTQHKLLKSRFQLEVENHLDRRPQDRIEQRISEAQEEFEHGRKSGLSAGWNRGFMDCISWCNQQDRSSEDVPKPENPFEARP